MTEVVIAVLKDYNISKRLGYFVLDNAGTMTLVWKRSYANCVQILLQRNVVFDALVISLILLPKPSSLALTQSPLR